MEAATGVANGRVVSLPMSASSSSSASTHQVRKEWRAISEHSVRNSSSEELERMKMGQSDERTIYEVQQRTGAIDVEYGSVAVDGDLMQQRLHDVSVQRERLQQMEIDLRAQMLNRSEIIDMQNRFGEQLNEHVNAAVKLKEHLQEREQAIRELELRIEEKDRELRAIKIDNEAAWAKEDLIREQNKELMAYRRERDNYETERAQQLQQIHDLKEHIQEKERQFLELEEQHRVLQETILYKDEQLREAQAWVARMDAMQSTTNHSLQTELRERTEQFNHFWLGCSRQFADMENHIRQLQLELAEARQRGGIYTDEASLDRTNSEEVPSFVQVKGTQLNVNEDGTLSGNSGVLPNGNVDDNQSFASTNNAPVKTDHGPGVPIPSSVLGLGAYIPPGQVTTLHPFFIPQQGVPQSVPPGNSHIPESHMGHFLPMPAISSHHVWQNQEVVADGSQLSTHNHYQPSQIDHHISTSSAQYEYEQSAEGHILHPGYVVANVVPNQEVGSINSEARQESQNLGVLDSQHNQENSANLREELSRDSSDINIETKVSDDPNASQQLNQGIITEKQQSASSTPLSSDLSSPNPEMTTERNGSGVVLPDSSILTGRTANLLPPEKVLAPRLLDERSLLACIVRAIPAGSGGRIKISSTLPNRLGKMLAPLHWHDYKKKYGKLDDFVAGHPELFFIEGDFIQLREGAQEMISATAAIAKVAAAAAASIPYTSVLPSVAVTPMAQTHRLKKVPSIDGVLPPLDAGDKSSQQSTMQNQHANGVSNIVQGLTNVKILSKPKYQKELNGSEVKSAQSSVHMTVANGTNPDGTRLTAHQNKGTVNGRQGVNFGGKPQGRDTGGALTSRR